MERTGTWNKTSNIEIKIITLITTLNNQKKKSKDLETKINKASSGTLSDVGNQITTYQSKKLLVREFGIKFRATSSLMMGSSQKDISMVFIFWKDTTMRNGKQN